MIEGIFYRAADGTEIPIKEVEGLKGRGAIILKTSVLLKPEEAEKIAERVKQGIGQETRVLVLDALIDKILRLEE